MAPWIWWGVHAASSAFHAPSIQGLSDHPFHRYVHRCVLGFAVLALWPLARALGRRSFEDLGWSGRPEAWRLWLSGVSLGAAMFGSTLVIELLLGARVWRADLTWSRTAASVVAAAGSALVVGPLEETVFRGVLCRGLSGSVGWPRAIGISSVVYAWVHFLSKVPSPDTVGAMSGFVVVWDMLRASMDVTGWMPGMPTLAVAGVLLGRFLQRTGSLHLSVGLHSGWVLFIKMRGALTSSLAGSGWLAGWGESRISAGWAGLAAVMVTALACEWWFARWEQGRLAGRRQSRSVGAAER